MAAAALAAILELAALVVLADMALAAAAVSVFLGKDQAVRAAQPLQVVRGLPALAAVAVEGLVLVDFKGAAQGLAAAAVLGVQRAEQVHQTPDAAVLAELMAEAQGHLELVAVTPELQKLAA